MKLSPERTSLSGRPDFLKPDPVQMSAPAPKQRICCMCAVPDMAQMVEGEPHHSVTVELRFIQAENEAQAQQKVTGYLKARGWKYRLHLGRHAMERDICRGCLIRHAELEKEFSRKKSNELKASHYSESYYLALCGD